MKDELGEHETFSQRCLSKYVSVPGLQEDEQLYSCVYRDFGAWRAVGDYRNKRLWIKYAPMDTDATVEDAGKRADELVLGLLRFLDKAGIR